MVLNIVTYHYIDALVTIVLMTLSIIFGCLSMLLRTKPRYKLAMLIVHVLLGIASYIAMLITFIRAPTL